jgi:dolichyl-phosphate-mannose-protein mannosyltransferase
MTPRRAELAFFGGLVVALVLLQSTGIGRPFLRQHESNGTGFGKYARNHLKFGLGTTRGLLLDVSGPRLDAYENYRDYFYSNHPPLSALLLAGAFALFGVGEATFRGFLIAGSVVALFLFRRLAARVLRPPYDRAATAFFALFPMFVYYSIVTGLQLVALIGVLGAFLFYLRWLETGRRREYAGIVASIALACYSSWEGYYAAPALVIAHLWNRRPRRGAALALLGVNGAIFGIYLLHLWAADPAGLDPLRSLLEAGVARSTLKGPPFLSYVAGEARELALMFTLSALGLVAVWAASLVRPPREDSDGLIAGSALLGLHEIVFAKLAADHEYYSYFLVVFVALGAAAGLSRLERRSRRTALATGLLAAVAFAGQVAWMLPRRLGREGGYEFYYRLGLAMRDVVPPEGRVFLLTDNIPFYTPFYGDRYSKWYDAPNRELVTENTGGRRREVSEEEVHRLLRENPEHLDWAVTAEKETAVAHVAWLRPLDDRSLEAFGVETRRTPRRELLEQLYGPPREHGGFLFWDLHRRR